MHLSHRLCLKCIENNGDFEKEVKQNGFKQTLNMIKNEMKRKWEGEKCVTNLQSYYGLIFVKFLLLMIRMIKVRYVFQMNDDKRGKQEFPATRLQFADICAVGLFTTDDMFCGEFQRCLRSHQSGCKWEFTRNAFRYVFISFKKWE